MSWRYAIFSRTGAAVLALATALPAMAATDCDTPIVLGDRPHMDAYADPHDFLAAVMDYQHREIRQRQQLRECPQLAARPRAPEQRAQPEDLDAAIERGRSLPAFDYARHPRWYDRTTSRTFGLPPLSRTKMDDGLVSAPIRMDEAFPAALQNALFALQGPLDDIRDGRHGEYAYLRRVRDHLMRDEQSAHDAAMPRPFTHIVEYRNQGGTWLRFYFLDDTLVYTAGFVAGCLAVQC